MNKFIFKWVIFKPILRLNSIINGKISNIKWYESRFNGNFRWKWLGEFSYSLSKKVMYKN